MLRRKLRRALRLAPAAVTLLFVSVIGMFSCREDLPTEPKPPAASALKFHLGDYFDYDNWMLDRFGSRIPDSRFRSSWSVADTGTHVHGRSGVLVIVDSLFASSLTGGDSLVIRDSIFLHVDSTGDLYWYGFIADVVVERESLTVTPTWDLVAALSQSGGSFWVVGRIDTADGGKRNETVFGVLSAAREYVATTVNGVLTAVLAYRVEITKPNFDMTIWIATLPSALARIRDDSDLLQNATLREVTQIVTTAR